MKTSTRWAVVGRQIGSDAIYVEELCDGEEHALGRAKWWAQSYSGGCWRYCAARVPSDLRVGTSTDAAVLS